MSDSAKSPPYGNCKVLNGAGELMFRCADKKVRWYLDRNLAEVVGDNPTTIRLLFQPNGNGHVGDEYFLAEKVNKCVVCGCGETLTRHHVVPKQYRRWFPDSIKSHHSHDIVVLCVECHRKCEEFAALMKKDLAAEYKIPVHGIGPFVDRELAKVRMNAAALKRHGDKMPPARAEHLKKVIRSYLGKEDISKEDIEQAYRVADPKLPGRMDHGKYVVGNLKESLHNFVLRWRRHFIEHMQPQHLPTGWSADRTIDRPNR